MGIWTILTRFETRPVRRHSATKQVLPQTTCHLRRTSGTSGRSRSSTPPLPRFLFFQ